MIFIDEVKKLSDQFAARISHLDTEEATKNSLVLPFIQMLGYDIFDPTEVIPEFTADVGTKRGEKVDYALIQNNKPAILVECKTYRSALNHAYVSQLFRYFTVTDARFGILTDGIAYHFFSDLDQQNVMDSKPFFEFNLLDFTESQVEELKQFTKSNFHESKSVERAFRLKYITDIKNRLAQEHSNPSDGFVRFIMRPVYAGSLTQKAVEQFRPMVREAFSKFVNESLTKPPGPMPPPPGPDPLVDWTPLSQIADVTKRKPPTAIRIDNGKPRPVKYWWQVLSEVAEWLVRDGRLTDADLPINGGGRGWKFINSVPRMSDGRDFRVPRQISGGIYLEMNLNAKSIIGCSKRLLAHYSIEQETVELHFEKVRLRAD